MSSLNGASGTALAVASPWAVVPSLGNLDAYISAVNRLPMLTLEEEQQKPLQVTDDFVKEHKHREARDEDRLASEVRELNW